MDFFARQEQARRQTKLLILLFVLAVISIVIAVDFVVAAIAANAGDNTGQLVLPTLAWAGAHTGLLSVAGIASASLIGLASLFRITSLRAGGGAVARSVGGTLVPPDTQDPLRRQLHNIVEEIAIASGIPVPEVYVLEQEQGLNAFAAGFGSGDAAITVTRGSLETFSRTEMQGVIAHEFSHVLNGDMRINMRLIGMLFGILIISLIGRTILRSMRYTRSSAGRSRNGGGGIAAFMAVGLALTVIGYLGLFFGRLIKAAVSRQREYLADASAVQFTRQTEGIAGALKKIGYGSGSAIENADGEEISHMFFADGMSYFSSLYATHPPIEKRIKELEPDFDAEQYLQKLKQQFENGHQQRTKKAAKPGTRNPRAQFDQLIPALLELTPKSVSDSVGNPSGKHIVHASQLRQLIPDRVYEAARSPVQAMFLTLALLLDQDNTIRDKQLSRLAKLFKPEYIKTMTLLHAEIAALGPLFRLPLIALAFPTLKRRPQQQIAMLLNLVRELIESDGRVDTFEYLLSRMLLSHLRDAELPQKATASRSVKLAHCQAELQTLFSVVAHMGHQENGGEARKAYQLGMRALLAGSTDWRHFSQPANWTKEMDAALERLDRLPAMIKEELIKALTVTISQDGQVTVNEAELLRAVCAILHCPLPPFLADN